jgi:hypothetical protein
MLHGDLTPYIAQRSARSSPRMLHTKGLHHDIWDDGHRQLLLVVTRLKLGVLVQLQRRVQHRLEPGEIF